MSKVIQFPEDKLALVEKHMRHLIANNALYNFSWSSWLSIVGIKTNVRLREAFKARYPELFKAYNEYQDLSLINHLLDKHPEWREKLPTEIQFP